MKTIQLLVAIASSLILTSLHSIAQKSEDQHLLDGTSMTYYYQSGSAVEVEFLKGQFKYKWIAGPMTDTTGQEPYRSRKIGDKMYLINFTVESTKTFVTLIYNFNENVMYSSVLFSPGTDQEMVLFEGGIIEHLKLKETNP